MIVLLSPAKNLEYDKVTKNSTFSSPAFQEESQQLIKKLKTLNSKKIGALMGLSEKLSDLNYHRYQNWDIPNKISDNARQAGFAFNGEVYRGLGFYSFSQKDIEFAQTIYVFYRVCMAYLSH